MNFTYKNIFKGLITKDLKQLGGKIDDSIDIYFDDLFEKIKSKALETAENFGNTPVDDKTLKSFYDSARKEIQSVFHIQTGKLKSLDKRQHSSWLSDSRRKEISWNYTERYTTNLEKSARSSSVIAEICNSSRDIVSKLGDPLGEDFYVKGLVVGEVQSGKTSSFNAVINRAIDCGYVLIIVFSGIMDDLRAQTQDRIEEDVIGEGTIDKTTLKKGYRGVGTVHRFGMLGDSNVEQICSVTSIKSDFNQKLVDADFSLNKTNILVCKKNVSIIKNLILWLYSYMDDNQTKHNIPLLIVDDEADNASLNNNGHKGREEASKTNGHIRALLDLFTKKSYLGYTATPFANVIQDRNSKPEIDWKIPKKVEDKIEEIALERVDNIFPDDFICLLESPSNYIGAKNIFDTVSDRKKIPLVEVINDYIQEFPSRVIVEDTDKVTGVELFQNQEEWNNKVGRFGEYLGFTSWRDYKDGTEASKPQHSFPKKLPPSLQEAIQCFILAIAVRESRNNQLLTSPFYQPHNTMLIHISRFTAWQNTTATKVEKFIDKLKEDINNDIAKNPPSDSIYSKLEKVWVKYYALIIENIQEYLPDGYVDLHLTAISYPSLIDYLPDSIKGLSVEAINSVTKKKLIYDRKKPKNVIAIGGNCLSRGFTLEGLTVNYFVRTTNFSDSLLQMGRWFGYRPGYIDCCKLFTSQELIEKFDSTTLCIEELENEFSRMNDRKMTPAQFELKVRKHPSVFKITRTSILKNTVDVKCSYQDSLEMTTEFDISATKMNSVWGIFKSNVAPLFDDIKEENGLLIQEVSIEYIISLLKLSNNFNAIDNSLLLGYLSKCKDKKKLTNWSLAVKTKGNAKKELGQGILPKEASGLPCNVGLSIRSFPKTPRFIKMFKDKSIFKASEKSANILSNNRDMSIRLDEEQVNLAHHLFVNKKADDLQGEKPELSRHEAIKRAERKTKPEYIYREQMSENEAVLLVYLFDSYYSFGLQKGVEHEHTESMKSLVKQGHQNLNIPIIGYAIGIPPIQDDTGVVYVKGDYELDSLDEELEDDADIISSHEQV